MMKKDNSGGSKNQKPRISGANPLQINEDDASRLVGGIVEKGFSDIHSSRSLGPPTAPRPSVLPFPVARHRSHGPNWAPKAGNFNAINDSDDMDEDVGEEGDSDVMVMAAGFAKPVERKEKKGLNFSRWQEIVKNEGNSVLNDKKKEKEFYSDNLKRKFTSPGDSELHRTSHFDHVNEPCMTLGDDKVLSGREVETGTEVVSEVHSLIDSNNGNIAQLQESQNDIAKYKRERPSEEILADLEMQNSLMDSGFSHQTLMGGEKENLESQIDAENRTRLAKMSAKEIAEAQAELVAKLDPALINALRKRGLSKVKGQKFSSSDIAGNEADSMKHETYFSELTASSGDTISQKPVELSPGDSLLDKDGRASPNKTPENRSMWNAWSKRVEHVRDLRFSLDGNIIDVDLAHVPDAGKASSESVYSADNVSERDFIRTEGDPGAAGYTIKEAVALTRSVVPGQRTLALQLIAAVLDRAIGGICQKEVDSSSKSVDAKCADWEAIWAFALGPEPELALALRMSLDDNHNSVVLSCAKAIMCALSCDVNEIIFEMLEKTPTYAKDVYTAPVFRSKPDVSVGFLRGGFWKYNTKPSNIRCFGEELESEKAEDERTIQDDIIVAGQDFAAGLVRMGILPRICYLLETDPAAPLEECLITILIAIARHSPTCAAAILDCERLVQTIVNRFTSNEQMEINFSKIKSVALLKVSSAFMVLARVEKKNCSTFMNEGILQKVTWHLYRRTFSLEQWMKSGKEACKLSSALLVEQLRLWKVFLRYGYCISEISDLFPSLCVWLSVPTFEKLIDNDMMDEYCAIANEAYLLLDVLAGKVPNFYSRMQDEESGSWNFLGSIIDQSLEWVQVKSIPCVSKSKLSACQIKDGGKNYFSQESKVNSLLRVISSVLNTLSSLLKAVIPEDITSMPNGRLPWLPEFVPSIGLRIIKNGYFGFSGKSNDSFVKYLCLLRTKNRPELAISSTCCLQALLQVATSVDELIRHANLDVHNVPSKFASLSREDKILADGILKSGVDEVQFLLSNLTKLIANEWQKMSPVENFGRGGPAPGVGVGWGASAGGYWSLNNFLAQLDAKLLVCMLEFSEIPFNTEVSSDATQVLNCALTACLFVGPGNNRPVIDKLLKFIFRAPVLKYLNLSIRKFLSSRKGSQSYRLNYEEGEYASFADILAVHFRNRWLGIKKKKTGKSTGEKNPVMKKKNPSLETIYEDTEETRQELSSSMSVEWARQRLPLPAHWYLSAISSIQTEKSLDFLEASRAGLFLLLGIETLSCSAVTCVPVVWKLHAMSAVLLSGMEILRDEKSREVYGILQDVYGEVVNEKKFTLQFGKEIHESYATFIETLVEQFAAESYGDLLFGRQVALYLHRSTEASTRLAAWNALSNARVLELLPPVDKCFTKAEGFLEPVEVPSINSIK
ncbi:RNA polymerase II-associated protein [Striga asiatica]|uniref:RNA polymerase II-associated protein n=1 Tax=Striga asiatica TaxID=4170 RepID=A0A5A7QXU8_STRAF|nr:RNA polymerase II-associated protein [Striga asiatica]